MSKESPAHTEIFLSGAPASPGIVIGTTTLYQRVRPTISDAQISDEQVQGQINKFDNAIKEAKNELLELLNTTDQEDTSSLIRTQIAILDDPELHQRVKQEISVHNKPVDLSVETIFKSYLELLKQNHRSEFQNRSIDISDIRDRLLQILHNKSDDIPEGTILVARELSPREIISFSNQNIKGIVTDRGGATSHAAIIARSMNIPMVVGLKKATEKITSDDKIVLDGRNGEVIIHPQEGTQKKYQSLIAEQSKREANFESICQKPNQTEDGASFVLQANVEFAEELSIARKYCAQGVGLLRTESIYLSRKDFQDIDQQVQFYRTMLDLTAPHPVTIRLFDMGGDKFFGDEKKQQNPFLGWRGIRMLLEQPKLLKNQLRAILLTAAKFEGRIRILVPMVSDISELEKLKTILDEVRQDLQSDGVELSSHTPLGVMVEVPSLALKADAFAKHADFFSIGTNDLAQYVLAVDRGNERISNLYNQRHPAIWRLIKEVVEAAKGREVPVSICGELASDPVAACCLRGFGIDTLSMNSVVIPTVKQALREHTLSEMQELAAQTLEADTVDDINHIFSKWEANR